MAVRIRSLHFILWLFLLVSCDVSQRSESIDERPIENQDLVGLLSNHAQGPSDLSVFFNHGTSAEAISATDGAADHEIPPFDDSADKSLEQTVSHDGEPLLRLSKSLINKDKFEIENEFHDSIDDLRRSNKRKDETIATLSRLNEELVREIHKLKNPSAPFREEPMPSEDLSNLQSQITRLKESLLEKSKDLNEIAIQNKTLENRISFPDSRLEEPLVERLSPSGNYEASSALGPQAVGRSTFSPLETYSADACDLEFDAVVTLQNGKNKEIFYTEFFLIERTFSSVIQSGGLYLDQYGQAGSYEQLWALSRKSPFDFPGVHKRIRDLLMEEVERQRGHRVRTDIDGFAKFGRIPTGRFYLVGMSPVGRVGIVWNCPVRLGQGANKISLTLANATWSE